jgi:hypothetical protein
MRRKWPILHCFAKRLPITLYVAQKLYGCRALWWGYIIIIITIIKRFSCLEARCICGQAAVGVYATCSWQILAAVFGNSIALTPAASAELHSPLMIPDTTNKP